MEQMSLDGLEVIPMDFENEQLAKPVRDFRPAVWKDGEHYCCLLGPDPQQGMALRDWTTHFRERLANADEDDLIAQEIKDFKSMSKDDVW